MCRIPTKFPTKILFAKSLFGRGLLLQEKGNESPHVHGLAAILNEESNTCADSHCRQLTCIPVGQGLLLSMLNASMLVANVLTQTLPALTPSSLQVFNSNPLSGFNPILPLPSSTVSPSKFGSNPSAPMVPTVPAPPSKAVSKPKYLSLLPKSKFSSHEVSSPGSPNVTVTPAEHPLSQYDSGKDSMTCSDASGHSNSSENQPANMIELDSPSSGVPTRMISGVPDYAPEFDPLVIHQSISHDSLFDSKYSHPSAFSISPTPVPAHNVPHHRSSLEGSYEGSTCSSGVWTSSNMSPSGYHQYNSQTSTSPKGMYADYTIHSMHNVAIFSYWIVFTVKSGRS